MNETVRASAVNQKKQRYINLWKRINPRFKTDKKYRLDDFIAVWKVIYSGKVKLPVYAY